MPTIRATSHGIEKTLVFTGRAIRQRYFEEIDCPVHKPPRTSKWRAPAPSPHFGAPPHSVRLAKMGRTNIYPRFILNISHLVKAQAFGTRIA
ncbi:MAG TPA: hypothetical protein DIW43_02230 [Spongiibacteraceae bacterium]|nr:hypothetical protein [Spongiibacteraceae bacterium]HCS26240.1 hypothetical protein [Spongiibacteraceae bacterium]